MFVLGILSKFNAIKQIKDALSFRFHHLCVNICVLGLSTDVYHVTLTTPNGMQSCNLPRQNFPGVNRPPPESFVFLI